MMRLLMLAAIITAGQGIAGHPSGRSDVWSRPRWVPVYTGMPRTWALFEVHSRRVRTITLPEDHVASDLAVAPSGHRIAYIARPRGAEADLLYLWDLESAGSSPRLAGEPKGRHSEPAFVFGEDTLVFAHNPHSNGGPGQHQLQGYAQLYELTPASEGPVAVTSEPGCHFSPTPLTPTQVALIHTSCIDSRRWISLVDLPSRRARRLASGPEGKLETISAAPDGKWLLVTSVRDDEFVVERLALNGGAAIQVATMPRGPSQPRPQFGRDENEVLIQSPSELIAVNVRTSARTRLLTPTSATLGGEP